MRTTVRLDDQLLAEAKQYAAKTGCSLTSLLENALRTFLSMNKRSTKTRRPKLPTFNGGGLRPGVDLDNSADLLDVLEGKNGIS